MEAVEDYRKNSVASSSSRLGPSVVVDPVPWLQFCSKCWKVKKLLGRSVVPSPSAFGCVEVFCFVLVTRCEGILRWKILFLTAALKQPSVERPATPLGGVRNLLLLFVKFLQVRKTNKTKIVSVLMFTID